MEATKFDGQCLGSVLPQVVVEHVRMSSDKCANRTNLMFPSSRYVCNICSEAQSKNTSRVELLCVEPYHQRMICRVRHGMAACQACLYSCSANSAKRSKGIESEVRVRSSVQRVGRSAACSTNDMRARRLRQGSSKLPVSSSNPLAALTAASPNLCLPAGQAPGHTYTRVQPLSHPILAQVSMPCHFRPISPTAYDIAR